VEWQRCSGGKFPGFSISLIFLSIHESGQKSVMIVTCVYVLPLH